MKYLLSKIHISNFFHPFRDIFKIKFYRSWNESSGPFELDEVQAALFYSCCFPQPYEIKIIVENKTKN
jgi:hypothetical protein